MKFIIYILYSKSYDVYYIGFSQVLEKRLDDHNSGKSIYTKGKEPWSLVFAKSLNSKKEALQFERMLKRQNRNYLDWLIQSDRNEIV